MNYQTLIPILKEADFPRTSPSKVLTKNQHNFSQSTYTQPRVGSLQLLPPQSPLGGDDLHSC